MAAISSRGPRRWTRKEYERMIAAGIFRPGERAELLDGEIVSIMTPQKSPHATAIRASEEVLRVVFGRGFDVRVQLPLALDDHSEPEPDVAVVLGSFRDYRDQHPTRAMLVVEVAQSSVATDRAKGNCYARAGIQDFWLINLGKRVLEVYRDPVKAPKARYGWKYAAVQELGASETISPLAKPEVWIAVADLLP